MARVCKGTMKRQWRGSRGDKPCRQILFSSLHLPKEALSCVVERAEKSVHFASYCISHCDIFITFWESLNFPAIPLNQNQVTKHEEWESLR